jgi:hypothetical protein
MQVVDSQERLASFKNKYYMTRTKRRSDRNHVIYEIYNTVNGKFYLGITAATGRRFNYSARLRFQRHCSRARLENKDWLLYQDMRKYPHDIYEVYVLDVVRGRKKAHEIEVKLLKKYDYKLNSTH